MDMKSFEYNTSSLSAKLWYVHYIRTGHTIVLHLNIYICVMHRPKSWFHVILFEVTATMATLLAETHEHCHQRDCCHYDVTSKRSFWRHHNNEFNGVLAAVLWNHEGWDPHKKCNGEDISKIVPGYRIHTIPWVYFHYQS